MIQKTAGFLLLLGVLVGTQTAVAESLNHVLNASANKTTAAQQSQKTIDKIADQTQEQLLEYRHTNKVVEDLTLYNRKLEVQLSRQQQRLQQIEQSIADATVVQRRILPLLDDMIESLANFIALDMPFHKEERVQRIGFLRDSLQRPELSIAEKFRQVLEAYKIESEYGRKIDTYADSVEIDGVARDVTVLRVGRVALLYQTADLQHTGMWNKDARSWQVLERGQYRDAVRQGVRMANRQASIDMLEIPLLKVEGK